MGYFFFTYGKEKVCQRGHAMQKKKLWNKGSFIELHFKPNDYEIVILLLYEFGSDLKKSKITLSLSDFSF